MTTDWIHTLKLKTIRTHITARKTHNFCRPQFCFLIQTQLTKKSERQVQWNQKLLQHLHSKILLWLCRFKKKNTTTNENDTVEKKNKVSLFLQFPQHQTMLKEVSIALAATKNLRNPSLKTGCSAKTISMTHDPAMRVSAMPVGARSYMLVTISFSIASLYGVR
jgi:hypothetical protein